MQLPNYLPALVTGLLTATMSSVLANPIDPGILVARQAAPSESLMRTCNLTSLGPTDWKSNDQPAPLLSDCQEIDMNFWPGSVMSSPYWNQISWSDKGAFGSCHIGLQVRTPKPAPPERPWFWIGDGDLLDFIDGVMERFTVGDKVLASSALFHCQSIHEPPNSIHEVEFILQASPFPKNHPE